MAFSSSKKRIFEPLHAADIPRNLGRLIFLYGAGGAGKTTMAGSLYDYPATKDTLFLVNDKRGLNVLRESRKDDLLWLPINAYQDMVDWIEQNKERPSHQNLVVDHFTKLIYQCFRHDMGPPPWDWQNYAKPTGRVLGMVQDFDEMASNNNMVILLILHDHWAETKEDGTTTERYEFNLSGGVAKAILPVADMIMHLRDMQDAKGTRRLTLRGSNTLAKKRIAVSSVEDTIPNQLTFPSYPTLVPILETLWEGKPFDNVTYKGRGVANQEQDPNQKVTTVIS